eukprot:snap_masked-scaffold_34-processed-gene-0.22-mRNA-1 protein AED:1.00 eAED:1.00 QI:0/0/0/0/1/1/2/0/493
MYPTKKTKPRPSFTSVPIPNDNRRHFDDFPSDLKKKKNGKRLPKGDAESLFSQTSLQVSDSLVRKKPIVISQTVSVSKPFGKSFFKTNPYWDSGTLNMLEQHWSFRFTPSKTTRDMIDLRIKFEGPGPIFELVSASISIGQEEKYSRNIASQVNESTDNSLKNISFASNATTGANLRFTANEARFVRDFIKMKRLIEYSKEELFFSITLNTSKEFMFASIKQEAHISKALQSKLFQVTQQRNNYHKSLQNILVNDNDAARLTEKFPTQPEIKQQYESFKLTATAFIQLRGPINLEDIINLLKEICLDISETVIKAHIRQCEETYALFSSGNRNYSELSKSDNNLSPIRNKRENFKRSTSTTKTRFDLTIPYPSHLQPMTATWRALVRGTTAKELNQVVENRGESVDKQIEQLQSFANFVWGLERYKLGNTGVKVDWELLGQVVHFERARWKSISRRMGAGTDCLVCLPPLETFTDETHPLSAGLVHNLGGPQV